MTVYLFAYHGPRLPRDKTKDADAIAAWRAWMDQLGSALEGSNNPVNITKTVNTDGSISEGGGANPVAGLSFITADSIDAALKAAKTCPQLAAGGSIEIAELVPR
ncbi:MAG TPA: hypothetical protein VMF90_05375 [Rhizobiaceae bacterium]|nr:hypothetical protein [Rhizobiaceae bacterium]